MVKIIALANQKGGVGKTTSCINLSAALCALKKKVLLVDLDPQGNATTGSGIDKNGLTYTVGDVFNDGFEIHKAIIKNTPASYDLLPANANLTTAEVQLLKKSKQERKLREAFKKLERLYDYILLDCPPTLNMLTLNALVAAHGIIVPIQCEYYALEGLSALMATVEQVQAELNPKLAVEGIVRTMFDPRNRLAQEVSKELQKNFGRTLYKTKVPRNVRLAEAPSFGLPILIYDKTSKGAIAYTALARELTKARKPLARVVGA